MYKHLVLRRKNRVLEKMGGRSWSSKSIWTCLIFGEMGRAVQEYLNMLYTCSLENSSRSPWFIEKYPWVSLYRYIHYSFEMGSFIMCGHNFSIIFCLLFLVGFHLALEWLQPVPRGLLNQKQTYRSTLNSQSPKQRENVENWHINLEKWTISIMLQNGK